MTTHTTTRGPAADPAAAAATPYRLVQLADIDEHAGNPRRLYDPEQLAELAESIRHLGILEPLILRPLPPDGRFAYQVLAGHRRLRAASMAGLERVPAVIREADDQEAEEIMLVENLQRVDLNPIERALGFASLQRRGVTQAEIGRRVGVGQAAVSKALSLLRLPLKVQGMVSRREITPSQAYALLPYAAAEALTEALAVRLAAGRTTDEHLRHGSLPYELEQQGLFKVLWHAHPECEECPLQSRVDRLCLNPQHYRELQDAKQQELDAAQLAREAEHAAAQEALRAAEQHAAALRERQRAARAAADPVAIQVLETQAEAAEQQVRDARALVESTSPLPLRSSFGGFETTRTLFTRPEGCSADCPCYRRARTDAGDVVELCIDPKRLGKLERADAKARKTRGQAAQDRRAEQLRTVRQLPEVVARLQASALVHVLRQTPIAARRAAAERLTGTDAADSIVRILTGSLGYPEEAHAAELALWLDEHGPGLLLEFAGEALAWHELIIAREHGHEGAPSRVAFVLTGKVKR